MTAPRLEHWFSACRCFDMEACQAVVGMGQQTLKHKKRHMRRLIDATPIIAIFASGSTDEKQRAAQRTEIRTRCARLSDTSAPVFRWRN